MSKYDFLFESDSPLFKKSSFVRISESVPEYPSNYKPDTESYMSSSNSNEIEEDLVSSGDVIEEDLMGVDEEISKMSPEDRSKFEKARTQLEKGISHLEEDVDTLEALNKIVEELNKKNDEYDKSVDPGYLPEYYKEPDWASRISHYMDKNKTAGLKPVGSVQDPNKSNKELLDYMQRDFIEFLRSKGDPELDSLADTLIDNMYKDDNEKVIIDMSPYADIISEYEIESNPFEEGDNRIRKRF